MDGVILTGAQFKEALTGEGLRINREKTADTKSGIAAPSIGTENRTFAKTLNEAIMDVNMLQKESNLQMQKLATGKTQNIHETMIKAEKADIALRLMMQVRNKLIDAYQEIMKMQV